jgi:predicted permease
VAGPRRQSPEPLPIVIGHGLWQRVFGGDPGVLGLRELGGRRVRIVGVMGPGVKFPGETNVWARVSSMRNRPPTYARLVPGATAEQLAAQFPALAITPLRDVLRPGDSRTVLLLFTAAGLLLLVAWVQVAALVVSSAVGRAQELGIRLALGGTRARLLRHFALENALLAALSLALGWLLAGPATSSIVAALPGDLRDGQYFTVDLRTLAFSSAVSLVGFSLLTVFPTTLVRRTSALSLLRGNIGGLPFTAERLRHALLVGQIALTGLLLYLSGLVFHSFIRAATLDFGFDTERVLLFTPPYPRVPAADFGNTAGMPDPEIAARTIERRHRVIETLDRLSTAPGVLAAATLFNVPLAPSLEHEEPLLAFNGRPFLTPLAAQRTSASVDFVSALGGTLVAGESFSDDQHRGREDLAVVNESLARQLAPTIRIMGRDIEIGVIGREIRSRFFRGRIIGVVKDLVDAPGRAPEPRYFTPDNRAAVPRVIAIRSRVSLDESLPAIRTVLQDVWGSLPPRQFRLMRDELRGVLAPYRSQALLLGIIAVGCLPLAVVGLSGALLYSVRVRTREIAIRLALGADPARVRRAVLRRAVGLVGIGLALGTLTGAAVGRVVAHQLFQVQAADPWTLVAVLGILGAFAWLAALVPARQAARTEPAAALRTN